MLLCAYVPPEGSSYYMHSGLDADGILMLESCLTECVPNVFDYHIIICGDLNGRTANVSQPFTADYDYFINTHDSGPVNVQRC